MTTVTLAPGSDLDGSAGGELLCKPERSMRKGLGIFAVAQPEDRKTHVGKIRSAFVELLDKWARGSGQLALAIG